MSSSSVCTGKSCADGCPGGFGEPRHRKRVRKDDEDAMVCDDHSAAEDRSYEPEVSVDGENLRVAKMDEKRVALGWGGESYRRLGRATDPASGWVRFDVFEFFWGSRETRTGKTVPRRWRVV